MTDLLLERFYARSRKRVMKAARAMMRVRYSDAYLCGHQYGDEVPYLRYCTYEPAEHMYRGVRDVISSLLPIVHRTVSDSDMCWQWELFSPDGFLACYSDGRICDANGEPIDGTDALATTE